MLVSISRTRICLQLIHLLFFLPDESPEQQIFGDESEHGEQTEVEEAEGQAGGDPGKVELHEGGFAHGLHLQKTDFHQEQLGSVRCKHGQIRF